MSKKICFILIILLTGPLFPLSGKSNDLYEVLRRRKIRIVVRDNGNNATKRFTDKLVSKYKFKNSHCHESLAICFKSEKRSRVRYICLKVRFKIKDKLNNDLKINEIKLERKQRKKLYSED